MGEILFASLLAAICQVESNNVPNAINIADGHGSSLGLCQIKYKTAKWLGYEGSIADLWLKPEINKKWAGEYLKYLLGRYNGDARKAVSAYNCGRVCNNKSYQQKVWNAYRNRHAL